MSGSARPGTGAICVLGMSRTGTSLTTRVLELAGVDLGPPEELLQKELRQLAREGERTLANARSANPEGFWEHYRMMRLNERILRTLGGSWREPPPLPAGWEDAEQLAGEREQARALLAESFAGRELWGWKDPRNSLTLPFWQRLVPGMRYVVCVRNPLDVASSLERRDGIALEQAVELWVTYTASALANTSGSPRIVVGYEDHFEDRHGTAARLARFAGRESAFDDAQTSAQLEGTVDERLWRNRLPADEMLADDRLPADALALHLATELLRTAPEPDRPRAVRAHAGADALARRLLDAVAAGSCRRG